MKKTAIAAILLASAWGTVAHAAPVVVTPGTTAGYMYFPPASVTPSGGNLTCHLVSFNAGIHGTQMLMGNGVISGTNPALTYTGFLRGTPSPQNSGTSRLQNCNGTDIGQCAWEYASYNNPSDPANGSSYYAVTVTALPVLSATPVACF